MHATRGGGIETVGFIRHDGLSDSPCQPQSTCAGQGMHASADGHAYNVAGYVCAHLREEHDDATQQACEKEEPDKFGGAPDRHEETAHEKEEQRHTERQNET